jgi:hypothetical protein
MKILQKGLIIISFLFLLGVAVTNVLFQDEFRSSTDFAAETPEVGTLVNDDLLNLNASMAEAQLIPSLIQNMAHMLKVLGLKNNTTVAICMLISIAFLILSYKVKITMDIYEFYNRNEDGSLRFNEIESLKTHYQNCVLGDVYLGSGLFFGLVSILIWVL